MSMAAITANASPGGCLRQPDRHAIILITIHTIIPITIVSTENFRRARHAALRAIAGAWPPPAGLAQPGFAGLGAKTPRSRAPSVSFCGLALDHQAIFGERIAT